MRDLDFPRRRPLWTTNVFSYPRLSRLKRRFGRNYFLFCVRGPDLRAAAADRTLEASVGRDAGATRFFATAVRAFSGRGAVAVRVTGAGARRTSAAGARCTSVNRV